MKNKWCVETIKEEIYQIHDSELAKELWQIRRGKLHVGEEDIQEIPMRCQRRNKLVSAEKNRHYSAKEPVIQVG